MTTAIACYCPLCDLPIWEASFARGEVADNHVFKCGELSYIELAHKRCAVQDNAANTDRPWVWDVS